MCDVLTEPQDADARCKHANSARRELKYPEGDTVAERNWKNIRLDGIPK